MYDRRTIFLRAHQLRGWNRRSASEKLDAKSFGRWLRMAWAEAKAGTLPSFAPAAIVARQRQAIEISITCLEQKDRLFPADYRHLVALRAARIRLSAPHGHSSALGG